MAGFFETPFMFWYCFIYLFLFCTGVQAVIQTRFLIKFSEIPSKKYYYFINICISYLTFIIGINLNIQQSLLTQVWDLFTGVAIIFAFSWKILKQNMVTSTVMAMLLITVNTLLQGILTPLHSMAVTVFPSFEIACEGAVCLLMLILTYGMLSFFAGKYKVKSNVRSQSLLVLTAPMLFIDVALRMLVEFKYFPSGTNYGLLAQIPIRQNCEFLGLTAFAILCVCGMLFTYEKMISSIERDGRSKLLRKELELQKNYVAETKSRYEATRLFRHDFKNHLSLLSGMIEREETAKAALYLKRFALISDYITFPVNTGNVALDIILSEKLSAAKAAGIAVSCEVTVPPAIGINDFDLCVIFSNGIDNGVKACASLESERRTLDIQGSQIKNFFIVDMINPYERGTVEGGTGLGLISIKSIAEKYHGSLTVHDENGVFRLSVLLSLE